MTDEHQQWNEQQHALQLALARPAQHPEWRDLALVQNAICHASEVGAPPYSFDDALWQGLEDAQVRRIPPKGEHSIAWAIWHAARCEDICMSMLVAGCPQTLDAHWQEALKIPQVDTGNAMDPATIAAFSAAIDISAMRAYRSAVGRQTQAVLRQLDPSVLKKKVLPERIQQVKDCGAVDPASGWLTDYWGSRTIAGLILMPATRHLIVHLNEAMKLK